MAFVSFLGRFLFVSVFIISAWQEGRFSEFGVDGGPAAKALRPKFDVFSKHVLSQTGIQMPAIEIKHLVIAAIALRVFGSLLFIFDSFIGAYLLLLHQAVATPILFDFYNYDATTKEFDRLFNMFTQGVALSGALLVYIGMTNSMLRRQHKRKASKAKSL